MRFSSLLFAALLTIARTASCADPNGAALYQQNCAVCHDASSATRAPAPTALRAMSPENIVQALVSGLIKDQGATLNATEKQTVAEFLTGKVIGQNARAPQVGLRTDGNFFSLSGPSWNGWGNDLANPRFQTTANAGLTADQIPRLKLKWAFAFPDTSIANGQPTAAGGRVFVPSANSHVYSLDARSDCQYCSFEPEAPVQSALSFASMNGKQVAFFGDRHANAYAVDAATGKLLWKVRTDSPRRRDG